MSYRDLVNGDIRLAALQLLEQDPGYSYNERILKRLLASLGHEISSDQLRTEIAWLSEQGLVTTEQVAEILVVRLTSRGEDAALGRARVPGVARPRP